jgi:hypothetical protein
VLLRELIPEPNVRLRNGEMQRKPESHLLSIWRGKFKWPERADDLDVKARRELETIIVEKRVEMFQEHAETARKLIKAGLDYLEDHAIDSSSDAIKAIVAGLRIEKESVGVPQALIRVGEMSDKQLTSVIGNLLDAMRGEKEMGAVDVHEIIEEGLSMDEELLEGEFLLPNGEVENGEED